VLAPGCPDGRPHYTLFRASQGLRRPSDKRGRAHGAFDSKGPGVASFGCLAGAERDDAAKGEEKRCITRSTFETSKHNNCNILLNAVETLETCF
jgi:hypothetical protein